MPSSSATRRLSLQDDEGTARPGGPLARRRGLRVADGARARGRAPGSSRKRATADAGGGCEVPRGPRQRGCVRARGRLPDALRGPRDHRGGQVLRVAERANGWVVAELEESPFPPRGWRDLGQRPRGDALRARAAVDVYRVGDDEALALEPIEGEIGAGETAARWWSATRLATIRNHTATWLPHAALRRGWSTHVRQAGSDVGPDKLPLRLHVRGATVAGGPGRGRAARGRLDRLELFGVEIETTRDEAEHLGAMALVREKYGERAADGRDRGVFRELCGGTHVSTTSEIGLFHVSTETSSASTCAASRPRPARRRDACSRSGPSVRTR